MPNSRARVVRQNNQPSLQIH